MRIGIIGTGNMGGMLANAFASADPDAALIIYNRTAAKADRIAEGHKNVHVAQNVEEVASSSDVVFVSTKSSDAKDIFDRICPILTSQQMLITTISAMSLGDLEQRTLAPVATVIPSIVQTVRSGVILVSYGPSMPRRIRERLDALLSKVGQPHPVETSQMRVSSDLASCGPAFTAEIMVRWAEAAASTGKLTQTEAETLLAGSLMGLARMIEAGYSFQDVIDCVAVPGGVTQTGLAVLRDDSPTLFERLHEATREHAAARRKSTVTHPQSTSF